jgi:hypothetical protein
MAGKPLMGKPGTPPPVRNASAPLDRPGALTERSGAVVGTRSGLEGGDDGRCRAIPHCFLSNVFNPCSRTITANFGLQRHRRLVAQVERPTCAFVMRLALLLRGEGGSRRGTTGVAACWGKPPPMGRLSRNSPRRSVPLRFAPLSPAPRRSCGARTTGSGSWSRCRSGTRRLCPVGSRL